MTLPFGTARTGVRQFEQGTCPVCPDRGSRIHLRWISCRSQCHCLGLADCPLVELPGIHTAGSGTIVGLGTIDLVGFVTIARYLPWAPITGPKQVKRDRS